MASVIGRIGTYFRREFAPDKMKWDRIVEDEKKGRSCPRCGRFGFYIHLPTSIREYWWGIYRCKGCKTEYRPRFTKGNTLFLAALALFYFNYFGQTGFTYTTFVTMAIGFAFALGVNYAYTKMGSNPSRTGVWLGALGWLLAVATTALAHHGEGVANGDPKDILYLIGSTGGFTFAGGSLLGLIPGVQRTVEELLEFLLSDQDPLEDDSLGDDLIGGEKIEPPEVFDDPGWVFSSDGRTWRATSEPMREEVPYEERWEGEERHTIRQHIDNVEERYEEEEPHTMQERVDNVVEYYEEDQRETGEQRPVEERLEGEQRTVLERQVPEGVDPDYERQQMEWWCQNQEDERMRLDSYRQHRQGDPDYAERVKDMEASLSYYNQKVQEQQERLNQFGIQVGEHKPVNDWDPFKVSQYERDLHTEQERRDRWTDAFDKFEKMREGAEQKGHELYSDPGKWDKGMDRIFRDDGEVDYDALNKARRVFQRSIEADVDTMAPEESHWAAETAIETARDTKNNPAVRIVSAVLTGGTSEIVFEPMDQIERMHQYVQYHDKGGSDWDAVQGAFGYGVKELAKDKLAVRELRTLMTGQVEMPDGTTRQAGTWDQITSVVGLGLKGKDLHSTTVKGEFWNQKALGVNLERVDDKGADFINKLRGGRQGSTPIEAEGPATGPRQGAGGSGAEPPGGGGRMPPEDTVPPGGGGVVPPKIPGHLADDYKAMQQAIANGDDAAANRYATRMLVKDQPTFRSLVRDGTIEPEVAQRAVGTQQVIIADGIKEGLERTKQTGRLLAAQIDVDPAGNATSRAPVKHMWSPGSGMEPFDPKNPRVPGDVDLTPVVDRDLCRTRGLDPDDVQRLAAGHTKDAINDVARQRLGRDIEDFSNKTRVKPLVPGSDEEYHSLSAHQMEGRVINGRGDIVDSKTTLGEESWPRSRETAHIVRKTETGRAMVAADESIQINKTVRELNGQEGTETWRNLTPEQKEARYLEGARETAKHHDRLEAPIDKNGANWKRYEIDRTKLNSPDGFTKTLDATRVGSPDSAREAIDRYYHGDYKKFYEDVQTSANQAVDRKLKGGGRIWDAQAEALREGGMPVTRESVIPHATGAESKDAMLRRFGVSEGDQHRIEWQNEIDRGRKPTVKNPGADLPTDGPDFQAKDQKLGIQREPINLWGQVRPPNLERLAEDNPDFKAMDDKIRAAWSPVASEASRATVRELKGIEGPDVLPHGTYAEFMKNLEKQNISEDYYKVWLNAAISGKWEPPK